MPNEVNLEEQVSQESNELTPSKQSIRGLDSLLFFISDVRNGIGPLLSIHLRNTLQWDPAKIGMALSAVEFSAFIMQIPAGLLADTAKRKRMIIVVACLLIILGSCMILFFQAFSLIILAQLMMGISIALIAPTLSSITLGLFGRKKFPSRVGKNEVWNHLGNVSSAVLAGLMGFWFGSQWIFFLVIGFALGSLISVSFIQSREIHYAVARELPTQDKDAKALPLGKLFRRMPILIFNLSLILYYIANGAQMSLVGQILANKDPARSAIFIAACMVIAEITMIAVAYTMSRIVNKFKRKTLFLAAFFILPIRAFLYTQVDNSYLFLLIQTLDGVAAGILGTMGTVINSDLAVDTGRFNLLQGMGAMSTNMGEAISQLFAGFVAKSFGFHSSFLALAGVALVGISFFSFLMPETKEPPKP